MEKNLWVVLLVLAGVAAAAWWRFHALNETQSVVVYVSHDEVFSEPILRDFEKETPARHLRIGARPSRACSFCVRDPVLRRGQLRKHGQSDFSMKERFEHT